MSDQMQKDILFDGWMESAVAQAFVQDMDSLPSIEELDQEFIPTPKLDGKINSLLHKHSRQHQFKKISNKTLKIAASIAIVFTVLSIALLSVEATREIIFNAFFDWKDNHTDIKFDDNSTAAGEKIFKPFYLPEGFSEISAQEYGAGYIMIFMNSEEEQIIFQQYPADSGKVSIDNENAKYREVQILGKTAHLFEATTDNNLNVLIWEKKGIAFMISSDISVDEMIAVGESIN